MVVAVEEGLRLVSWCSYSVDKEQGILRGFFLRNRNPVSKSSRYLVR